MIAKKEVTKEKTTSVANIHEPGKWLEKLIETIERQAHNREGVTVEAPKFLPDRITGALREFDVLITIEVAHHKPILMALECRDRSRPVGVNDIESFRGKCEDTGIGQGIIVSATGFAETARQKAKHYNIGCFEIAQAERFGWCNAPGIFGYERTPKRIQVTAIEVDESHGAPNGPLTLLYEGNQDLGREEIDVMASNIVMAVPLDHEKAREMPSGTVFKESVQDLDPNFAAIDSDGRSFRVNRIALDLYFEVKTVFTPFQWHTYSDTSGAVVKETATADVIIAGRTVNVAIIGEPNDGPKQVVFSNLTQVPKKPRKRKTKSPKRKK